MKKNLLKLCASLLAILLLLIILPAILTSCKKLDMSLNEKDGLLNESATAKKSKQGTITTEPYNAVIFDSCRRENVILSGQAIYKLIESFENGYFIYYEIRLDKITGVGEITGIVYHGGGKILGRLNEDGTKVRGKVTYKVKYVGNKGNQIFFTQNARFIQVNNEIKVEFNDIFDSCK